jgi:rRNA processing protein Gar1
MPKYRPGDRVTVPWGLDEATGTVVDVFGPPGNPFVVVRVDLSGIEAEEDKSEVGFKADDIKPASPKHAKAR